jgi:hypothetical protein
MGKLILTHGERNPQETDSYLITSSYIFKLPFFRKEFRQLRRACPVMLGAIHYDQCVYTVGGSNAYLKSDFRNNLHDEEEERWRRDFLGKVYVYDDKLHTALNDGTDYEFSEEEEEMIQLWRLANWGVFRCYWKTEESHPGYYEPECVRYSEPLWIY